MNLFSVQFLQFISQNLHQSNHIITPIGDTGNYAAVYTMLLGSPVVRIAQLTIIRNYYSQLNQIIIPDVVNTFPIIQHLTVDHCHVPMLLLLPFGQLKITM